MLSDNKKMAAKKGVVGWGVPFTWSFVASAVGINAILTATAAWFCERGHPAGIPGIPLPPCLEPTAGPAAYCGKPARCPECGWSVAKETEKMTRHTLTSVIARSFHH